ncbi:hypothetical protein SMALA_5375 [Streptomyces malaysiensis subsp. malaysiensis]|nr:hypothetical protein SMALA_5375 [Streptomyces malaysiensis]
MDSDASRLRPKDSIPPRLKPWVPSIEGADERTLIDYARKRARRSEVVRAGRDRHLRASAMGRAGTPRLFGHQHHRRRGRRADSRADTQRPEEPEGALFILVQDGAHGLFFHFTRVSIARADDISFDAETLAGLPVPARARPELDVPGHHPRLAVRPAGLITSSAPDH